MKSARFVVYELLKKMEKNAYSNLALDANLSDSKLSDQDKSFVSRLFYGVIERKITLCHVISVYSTKPLHKIDRDIIIILSMGIYQILYMDSVPDNAAVNESVELVKQIRKNSAAGFVNAVLRSFIRDDKKISLPVEKTKAMSIKYSCNENLVDMLLNDYSEEDAVDLISSSLGVHKLYIRVNNTKISDDDLINELAKLEIKAKRHTIIENCLIVERLGSVEDNFLYKNGYFHVQDLSSQLCCLALNVKSGENVLDVCAAPGGKALTITEIMTDIGKITACDLHLKRVELVKSAADRACLTSITALQNDAKLFNSEMPLFDKVLCDVPCSGFGVMRSKPEIKYKNLLDIANLPEIQYEILKTSSRYLKVGGELVYSTCTLSKKENDDVIDKFLFENSDFEGVSFLESFGYPFGEYKASIFPRYFDCEGFFISKIRRIR